MAMNDSTPARTGAVGSFTGCAVRALQSRGYLHVRRGASMSWPRSAGTAGGP